jgi:hypothetical protein
MHTNSICLVSSSTHPSIPETALKIFIHRCLHLSEVCLKSLPNDHMERHQSFTYGCMWNGWYCDCNLHIAVQVMFCSVSFYGFCFVALWCVHKEPKNLCGVLCQALWNSCRNPQCYVKLMTMKLWGKCHPKNCTNISRVKKTSRVSIVAVVTNSQVDYMRKDSLIGQVEWPYKSLTNCTGSSRRFRDALNVNTIFSEALNWRCGNSLCFDLWRSPALSEWWTFF